MLGNVGPIEAMTDRNRWFRPVAEGMRQTLTDAGKRRLRPFPLYALPWHAVQMVETATAVADRHETERASVENTQKDRK
jgi:hypothetical protein